jgi:2-hydroxy-6-oxonona-2,4-dienedioate hydrolase
VDYIHRAHTWSPEFIEARRKSVGVPRDYTQDLAGIEAPVLLIHGRYDRMVAFKVSIATLNHVAASRLVLLTNCGHWPSFEKPAEWTAQVLTFRRVLSGTANAAAVCQKCPGYTHELPDP